MGEPASRYADKVSSGHAMAMEAVGLVRLVLDRHRQQFEVLLKAKQDMDNCGGLLDPTLYRDMLHSKSFDLQLRLVQAALNFMDAIDAVAGEVERNTIGIAKPE